MSQVKAAIFDIGGVLTSSPVMAIREYVNREGADYTILGPMIADHDLAWSRWERSEITGEQFIEQFEAEAVQRGVRISAQGVMDAAFGTQTVRDDMVAMVRFLRGKVRLGAITNNVLRDDSRPRSLDIYDLFEHVIESAKAGIRKPDPRIYRMACEALEVETGEAVFLDDIGANLKGAKSVGMLTIRVDATDSAIGELENVLGFALPRGAK